MSIDEKKGIKMSSLAEKTSVMKPSLNNQLHDVKTSVFKRYCLKAIGKSSIFSLLLYEVLTTFLGGLGGGIGYLLRRFLYPFLFCRCGKSLIFGKDCAIRHSWKISVGHRVSIDNNVLLDASGSDSGKIVLGDGVVVSSNATIQRKAGSVFIGDRTIIANNVVISSVNEIKVEEAVLIAGNCYIGGGRYNTDQVDLPIMDQGMFSKGPLRIGAGSWLGAGAVILDGVDIGKGCIIGSGAVVTRSLPDYSIALGSPARVVATRKEKEI